MRAPIDAMIFAAGQGTRLGDLGTEIPKALLPVWRDADTLEPILLRLIRQVALAGPEVIRVVVNHHRERIASFVARSPSLQPLRIELVHQAILDGEAGGLFLTGPASRPVLAIDGDNYLEEDLFFARLVEAYFQGDYVAVIGVHAVPDITRYANVKVSAEGLLVDIVEKPSAEAAFGDLAKMGAYVLGPSLLQRGKDFFRDARDDLATTAAFSNACALRERILCVRQHGYYIDVGTLDGYLSHLTGQDR